MPQPGTGRIAPVGSGRGAMAKVTYRLLASAFHDGSEMEVADLVYPYALAFRWGEGKPGDGGLRSGDRLRNRADAPAAQGRARRAGRGDHAADRGPDLHLSLADRRGVFGPSWPTNRRARCSRRRGVRRPGTSWL